MSGGDPSALLEKTESSADRRRFQWTATAPGLGAFRLSLNAENIDLGESTITALGDLSLSANGTLTVKDLNALGDLILQGSELIIQLEDGRTVDMICGGDLVVDVGVCHHRSEMAPSASLQPQASS